MKKNNTKTFNAWCLYDWANSSYSLVITSAIFPAYFLSIAVNNDGGKAIGFLCWKHIDNAVLYAYIYSFSSLIILISNPIFCSIADKLGNKKMFMKLFSYLGAVSCVLLFFADTSHLYFTSFLFLVSSVSYSIGVVFYNSFLPAIATPDKFNMLSARGFAWGYVGGMLMLLINLFIIQKATFLGFTVTQIADAFPIKISFVLVGFWWLLFAQISFKGLPSDKKLSNKRKFTIFKSAKNISTALREIASTKLLLIFLLAFFFYNMGVQTIMGMASVFAKETLSLSTSQLIITILLLQILAIVGSYFFVAAAKRFGNISTIIFGVISWIVVCIVAFNVKTIHQFYILSVLVGLLMGGIQSLSRATFAKLLQADNEKQVLLFGFYDMLDKVGVVLGTFLYGLAQTITGSMRYSILLLGIFFLIAFIILSCIPKQYHEQKIKLAS